MSDETRVDVIAVMDELVNYLWNPFEPDNQDEKYKRAVRARDAVDELIEAAADVERRAGHDREPRLRAALSTIRSTL